MEITVSISNAVLRQAIELRISECFQAMNIANSLGGSPSPEWELVRKYSLTAMVEEALDRGMDVGSFRAAVDNTRFQDCRLYFRVRDEIGGRSDFPT